jgi:hypothetical protein
MGATAALWLGAPILDPTTSYNTRTLLWSKKTIAMDNFSNDDDPVPDMDSFVDDEPNHYQTLMQFLQNSTAMRQTAHGSLRQGLICGGGAVTGGLLLGPVGGLVGGVAGSIYGFLTSPNYDGVIQQFMKMEDTEQRHRLLKSVRLCLLHAGANAASFASPQKFHQTLVQFTEQREVRDHIWKACMDAM